MLGRNDAIDILSAITAADKRRAGEADILIWQQTLNYAGGITKEDALRAVVEHKATSDVYLEPVHIIRLCQGYRRARVEAAPSHEELMADVDDEDPNWTHILQQRLQSLASGAERPRELEA